jgi:hypothetical protein
MASAFDDHSYARPPKAARPQRFFGFAIEMGAWWLAVLVATLLGMPLLLDAIRVDAVDRWRAERLAAVAAELAADLAPYVDLASGGFRDRAGAEALLDRVLTADTSIRSIELYNADRRQHLTTDRGSLGAAMPPTWQRALGAAQGGAWVAASAAERDYALGTRVLDTQGNFVGDLVVAAGKPGRYAEGLYHVVAIGIAALLAIFAAVLALVVLVMPYARVVASEESDLELVGDEMPDDDADTAPRQARDVVARVRRRLKAALALLGAEAGTG